MYNVVDWPDCKLQCGRGVAEYGQPFDAKSTLLRLRWHSSCTQVSAIVVITPNPKRYIQRMRGRGGGAEAVRSCKESILCIILGELPIEQ